MIPLSLDKHFYSLASDITVHIHVHVRIRVCDYVYVHVYVSVREWRSSDRCSTSVVCVR